MDEETKTTIKKTIMQSRLRGWTHVLWASLQRAPLLEGEQWASFCHFFILITGPGAPSLRSFAHVYSRLGCWIQDSTSFLLGRHLSRFAIALHNSL